MKADANTFSSIVYEYSQALYWHIRRMVVNHEDAQDILQETLIKAYKHLWQLHDKSALRPWLYRIATNQANSFLSRQHQTDSLSEELTSNLMDSEYVDYSNLEGIKLQKAILSLSPQQRVVFCLRYYDGMEYPEIAEITGSSPETLKVSYHYAKDKIKKIISEL